MTAAVSRILVTNDDGVDAPGMGVLEDIAAELCDDVWVSAPEFEQSGASRKLSLSEPVRVRQAGPKRFAVRGTPSDAAFLGLHDIVEGARPDLVLSGVNRGQNLADDVTVSGTVAAAIQAMQMGVPSIALSQTFGFRDGDHVPFETARAHAPGLIRSLLAAGWPTNVVLNVNFPDRAPEDVEGVEITRQGSRDQWHLHAERREDLRKRTYYWIGFRGKLSNPDPGDDLKAIYEGRISVTPLQMNLTDADTRTRLSAAIGGAKTGA